MLQNGKQRDRRRGWGIMAYVGPNGSGKSLAAVWDTLPSLDAGRKVLSTVRLLDWRNPRLCDDERCTDWRHPLHQAAHPCWVPFTSWDQLVDARRCDILMDEVTGIASSRSSLALPGIVEVQLQQLRHRDVSLRWTAPAWARAELIVRENTIAVTQCTGYLPVTASTADRMWRPRRLFRWRTFDRADFTDFLDGTRQALRPLVKQWFWGPDSSAFGAYDSLDDVLMVGTVTESGRCAVCGGQRSVPRCHCEDTPRAGRRRAPAGPPPTAEQAGVPVPGDAQPVGADA